MREVTADEIERLLDDERSVLLAGDLSGLAALAERKEELSRALGELRPPAAALAALRAKAERNAELLAAAARGVRSVTRRVSEIRSAHGPLRTYGSDGASLTLGTSGSSFEKRA